MTNGNGPCADPRNIVVARYRRKLVDTSHLGNDAENITVHHIRPQKDKNEVEAVKPEEVKKAREEEVSIAHT